MKGHIAAAVLVGMMSLMVGGTNASAARISLGPQIGFGLNEFIVSGSNAPSQSFLGGFTVGGDLQLDLTSGLGIDIPVIYEMAGSNAKADSNGDVKYRTNYVSVPIGLKLILMDGPVQTSIRVGPTLGFLIGANSTVNGVSTSDKSDFNSVVLAAHLGVGVQFPIAPLTRLDISARTQISLLNSGNLSQTGTVRNLALQILIAPLFGISTP